MSYQKFPSYPRGASDVADSPGNLCCRFRKLVISSRKRGSQSTHTISSILCEPLPRVFWHIGNIPQYHLHQLLFELFLQGSNDVVPSILEHDSVYLEVSEIGAILLGLFESGWFALAAVFLLVDL